MEALVRIISILLLVTGITACAQTSNINPDSRLSLDQGSWQQLPVKSNKDNGNSDTGYKGWYQQYANAQLVTLIDTAISNNQSLQQLGLSVQIQKRRLSIAEAALFPMITLGIDARRDRSATSINNSASIELSSQYEIDLWGKLNAQQQSNLYRVLSTSAQFEEARQLLVVEVMSQYANAIQAHQLLQLYEQRSATSKENLNIIEIGYKSGLNEALDVYLARNEHNSNLAKIAAQRATKVTLLSELQRLLGQYPSGNVASEVLNLDTSLPDINRKDVSVLPSEVILQKPTLQSAWLDLLSADANLAVAHKQRFPSFTLNANVGKNSDTFKDILSTDLVWSLIAGISAPLFDAGTLKANEDIALYTKQQAELDYIQAVYDSFADVERALFKEQTLVQQYTSVANAKENALIAESLAFEQYLKGLVTYTTVLDAQTRSVDAQSSLITIQSQLFINRIQLHFALGSSFNGETYTSDMINEQI
jgi:outer membrane protein, multidrug efflux system